VPLRASPFLKAIKSYENKILTNSVHEYHLSGRKHEAEFSEYENAVLFENSINGVNGAQTPRDNTDQPQQYQQCRSGDSKPAAADKQQQQVPYLERPENSTPVPEKASR
jgi:hypothetical protein